MNRFVQYKVTKELLYSYVNNFDDLYNSKGKSSEEEIRAAIEYLIPRQCGRKLIRIGGDGDGGYLVPDDLTGIEACFSPGVNNFKNFEDQLALNYGIKSFMCDFSSDVKKLRTPLIDGLQFFEKKWLDVVADADNLDINDWVLSNSRLDSDLMLQIDIEGAEYRNLLHASIKTLARFRIIVMEIHGLSALAESGFLNGIFLPAIRKISSLFTCVHAHPNNCCGFSRFGKDLKVPNVLELTFLRNDRKNYSTSKILIPNPLDQINVSKKPPLHLDGDWLKDAEPMASELVALRQSINWLEDWAQESNKHIQQIEDDLSAYGSQIFSLITKNIDKTKNIALGKKATQSSLSAYSTPAGANGAINGNKTGYFGFHTSSEQNPWWMVDLENIFDLSAIVVYNRLDAGSERSRTLKVNVSEDGLNWNLVYDHSGRRPFGGIRLLNGIPPLFVDLNHVKARFVKLECVANTYFHLDEVEVFGFPVQPV